MFTLVQSRGTTALDSSNLVVAPPALNGTYRNYRQGLAWPPAPSTDLKSPPVCYILCDTRGLFFPPISLPMPVFTRDGQHAPDAQGQGAACLPRVMKNLWFRLTLYAGDVIWARTPRLVNNTSGRRWEDQDARSPATQIYLDRELREVNEDPSKNQPGKKKKGMLINLFSDISSPLGGGGGLRTTMGCT
ncbi:hypothetical protein GGX14DRAFT_392559 [Mycena pura]|uniref:Uncharacterized protein n=1 Tax=Mycena pura TaxID=153505 RepID=A0AAD6VJ63_9AGAR|nr:hypothetical protein GGX14DRAFT_392559 [Mycena pura]